MFYVKETVDLSEINEGASITIDLNRHKIHSICPGCGADSELSAHEIANDLVLHNSGESVYCADCSTRLTQVRREVASTHTRAEALKKWAPDDERDKLPAVSVLWTEYRYLANSIGEDHDIAMDARKLLERVMGGPIIGYRDEIQCSVLTMLSAHDGSVEDAAEGDEELCAFYRRVLGIEDDRSDG